MKHIPFRRRRKIRISAELTRPTLGKERFQIRFSFKKGKKALRVKNYFFNFRFLFKRQSVRKKKAGQTKHKTHTHTHTNKTQYTHTHTQTKHKTQDTYKKLLHAHTHSYAKLCRLHSTNKLTLPEIKNFYRNF